MRFTRIASVLALAGSGLALPNDIQHERLHARDAQLAPHERGNMFAKRQSMFHGPHTASGTTNPPTGTQTAQPSQGGGSYGGTTGGSTTKIRGVNLGSLFDFEPWIAQDLWNADNMCGSSPVPDSELTCAQKLGQEKTNDVFQNHWKTWYTQDDFDEMASYGLNTVRIPVGYWLYEAVVDRATYPFAEGGIKALAAVCKMAKTAKINVIIDHHAAPGAQQTGNPFTGVKTNDIHFFDADGNYANYDRAQKFLGWMAQQVAADQDSYGSVTTLQVLNEPIQNDPRTQSMISKFYPGAQKAVRDTGSNLKLLYMDEAWSSGNPLQNLDRSDQNIMVDNHRYLKWAYQQGQSKDAYNKTSCTDNRDTNDVPTVVGEWSLSPGFDLPVAGNEQWYAGWFAAQVRAYESGNTAGWIFWTWKGGAWLNDPRWDYRAAVQAGIIPKSLDGIEAAADAFCGPNQKPASSS